MAHEEVVQEKIVQLSTHTQTLKTMMVLANEIGLLMTQDSLQEGQVEEQLHIQSQAMVFHDFAVKLSPASIALTHCYLVMGLPIGTILKHLAITQHGFTASEKTPTPATKDSRDV